ncbi:MAG: hypothetical protein FWE67_13545, partial [Planctomycetaceae bacterium]|nr:hypothetical protein [Planctomycetaceae bacterium]
MLTYHITCGTYGTRLHGGIAPTVALPNNHLHDHFVEFDPLLYSWRRELMVQEPVYLTDEQRLFVESEIPLLCNRGGWSYHIAGCQR